MRRDTGQETVHGPGTDGQTSFDWLGLGGFNHRSSATGPVDKDDEKDWHPHEQSQGVIQGETLPGLEFPVHPLLEARMTGCIE